MNPTEYLTERVSKVVINSDKLYNEGARLIAHFPTWECEIQGIVDETWDLLLRYCARNKSSTYSASVKLTFASDLIGKRICRILGIDGTNIKSSLSLGDLILESFLQENLIEIHREYEGFKAPYMVRIINQADDIKPTLIGTCFEPPEPIRGLISPVTKDPFIKGWTNGALFKEYLDKPFIRALESLRQQPWELNQAVLEVVKNNPPPTEILLMDDDGVVTTMDIHKPLSVSKQLMHMDKTPYMGKNDPRVQKLMSKFFEYTQIVRKAEMISDKTFYQEVSCDYRGRIYYSESFLEFQGSDLARSMFLFKNKKKMTTIGYRWLCIHAAACYNQSYTIPELKAIKWLKTDYIAYLEGEGLDTISVDKMTLDDRYTWMQNNLALTSEGLRENAEKPYSFYACSKEIKGYLDMDGDGYMSGFPIPLDGSNNGERLPF